MFLAHEPIEVSIWELAKRSLSLSLTILLGSPLPLAEA